LYKANRREFQEKSEKDIVVFADKKTSGFRPPV